MRIATIVIMITLMGGVSAGTAGAADPSTDDQKGIDARRTSSLRAPDVPREIPEEIPISVGIRPTHVGDFGPHTDSRRQIEPGRAANHSVLDDCVIGKAGVPREKFHRCRGPNRLGHGWSGPDHEDG